MCSLDNSKILGSEYNAQVNEPTPASSHRSRLMSGCLYLGRGVARCVRKISSAIVRGPFKGLVLGGFLGSYARVFSGSAVFFARKMHLISPLLSDEEFAKNIGIDPVVKAIQARFSNATIRLHGTGEVLDENASAGLVAAVAEELFLREIVQDVVLKRIPVFVLKKLSPGKEAVLDTKIYTVARIVLTSSLFALTPLYNLGTLPDSYVQAQIISTFAKGIFFGLIKESNLGLLGAIYAHFANNLETIVPHLPATGNH